MTVVMLKKRRVLQLQDPVIRVGGRQHSAPCQQHGSTHPLAHGRKAQEDAGQGTGFLSRCSCER